MNATSRKRVSGAIRDKERTMLKLIQAVGEIIKTEGYTGLGINRIAKKAEVDKKLIYRYFKNVNLLIETYVKTKDYWLSLSEDMDQIAKAATVEKGKPLAKNILRTHLSFLFGEDEMQKIVLWEISEKSKFIKDICFQREQFGDEVFKMIEPHFEESNLDVRATLALQVAGIIFLVLQAKSSGNPFCGIDINKDEDMERILSALDGVVDMAYQQIEMQEDSQL